MLLAGVVASACLRALLPATFLLIVALALGVDWPGLLELALAAVLVMGLAAAMACYATLVALRFRTQQAAPLMQMGSFIPVLFTTSYAPRELLSGWLRRDRRRQPRHARARGRAPGVRRRRHVGRRRGRRSCRSPASSLVFGALAVRGMRRQGL